MKAPTVIYLQFYGDAPTTYFDEDDNEVPILEEDMEAVDPYNATWCEDRIYDADIEYVRSDRYREAVELLKSVYTSGVSLDDERIRYMEVQIYRADWQDIGAFLAGEDRGAGGT